MKQNYIELASALDIVTFDLLKATLRSHDIEFLAKDEFTLQADPFAAQAILGAKIMVLDGDFHQAREILIEGGFTNNLNQDDNISIPFMADFQKFASQIPIVRTWRLEIQLITIIFIIALFFLFIGYLLVMPSEY